MGLARAFVGFSSSDINAYRTMQMWKANKNIDFNFYDCQLAVGLDSENEKYIKQECRKRINMAGYYILLIGENTRYKHKYVLWEAEVALEKDCHIIGINLNNSRSMDEVRTPGVIKNVGAYFIPFRAKALKYTIENMPVRNDGNWSWKDRVYTELGYIIKDGRVENPPPSPPDWRAIFGPR